MVIVVRKIGGVVVVVVVVEVIVVVEVVGFVGLEVVVDMEVVLEIVVIVELAVDELYIVLEVSRSFLFNQPKRVVPFSLPVISIS